jgi:hypothetical protein
MIRIDKERCISTGKVVKSLKIRPEFYNREFIRFDADRETKLRVYLLSVAICHQTHNLRNPEKNLYGWEYLEHGFLEMFRSKNALLNPGYLSICHPDMLRDVLLSTFAPDGDPLNSTLDRIEERVAMITEICNLLKSNYDSSVSQFIDQSGGYLLQDDRGIYESLAQMSPFADPLCKKSSFFIKLATNAGLIYIRDPENLVPIMDYHMQRVLLRMGCVQVNDTELMRKLKHKEPLDSDQPVRQVCIDALSLIAEVAGRNILEMNDIFWPLGRSCCEKTTLCQEGICIKSPCSFNKIIQTEDHGICTFQPVCQGALSADYRDLWEPFVKTHYY